MTLSSRHSPRDPVNPRTYSHPQFSARVSLKPAAGDDDWLENTELDCCGLWLRGGAPPQRQEPHGATRTVPGAAHAV